MINNQIMITKKGDESAYTVRECAAITGRCISRVYEMVREYGPDSPRLWSKRQQYHRKIHPKIYQNELTNESGDKFFWGTKCEMTPESFAGRYRRLLKMHGHQVEGMWITGAESKRRGYIKRKIADHRGGNDEWASLSDSSRG